VENVPATNQVYEFLDRLGVRGVLPNFSAADLPLSRREVARLLEAISLKDSLLSEAEAQYVRKFREEFALELGIEDTRFALIGSNPSGLPTIAGLVSDREKYVLSLPDSGASVFVELLASAEYRPVRGDTYGNTSASLATIGGRIRGTVMDRLGYFLQSTNGQVWGDRDVALDDPSLAGNVKFNDLGSPYFDITDAYLALELGYVTLQIGKEQRPVGVGYGDRLVISGTAPAFDFIGAKFRYKSVLFTFLHGALTQDSTFFAGLLVEAPQDAKKYFAMHRFQASPFNWWTFAVGEMVIYQRVTPELAYLNPVNFYKSAEHALGDKDNAFIFVDLEFRPAPDLKLYGSWLMDDIDFSKLGTGWWGNLFGWHAGGITTNPLGVEDVDLIAEYLRLEPYVYSNRIAGNDYTHANTSVGASLPPNADSWDIIVRFRARHDLRLQAAYGRQRHGANVVEGDSVVRNVGGSVMQGHRPDDSPTAIFLDGVRETADILRARADYEPIRNLFLAAALEYRWTSVAGVRSKDLLARLQLRIEY
jgi:hypothetical protein